MLLSDIDSLYTAPPTEPGAERIAEVAFDDGLEGVVLGDSGSAGVGTGGATTKVAAARLAAEAGIPVLLTATSDVSAALAGEPVGTWFHAGLPERAV